MKKRKKQDITLGVIAVIGIVLILSAAWVFSKGYRFSKYKNEKEGYSISYPSDWALEEGLNGVSVIFLSNQDNELDFFRENVSVVVQDLSSDPMNLTEYSAKAVHQMEAVFKDNLVIRASEPALFAKIRGYKFEYFGKGEGTDLHFLIYWTVTGLTAYQVTYTAVSSQYERYLPKVNRMIQSFRIK